MRIWNCKDYEFASMALMPWFVPANQKPLDMGWELHERLRLNPDNTFCLIMLENNIIQGIAVAYVRKRDVWLWQAHVRKGFKYTKMIFEGLKVWAKSKNRKKLRMGVFEKVNSFQRRWGFRPCRWNKHIMEQKL